MADVLQNRFADDKQLLKSLAEQTGLYDNVFYTSLNSNEEQVKYLEMVASTKDITKHRFKSEVYQNMLDPIDRVNYLTYSYYQDKDEQYEKYFTQKVTEKLAQDIYKNTSEFKKAIYSTGVMLGNAVNETVFGTLEGLIDLGMLLVGAPNEVIAEDVTGVGANREKLYEATIKYTNLDKNFMWKLANDTVTGFSRLTVALIPGVGQTLYFAGMSGNIAGRAVVEKPTISRGALLGYTALSTASEIFTEKLFSSPFFEGFIPTATTGNMIKDTLIMGLGEAIEESTQEIFESVLNKYFINSDADTLPPVEDVLYAGLVGFLVAVMSGTIITPLRTPKSVETIDPATGQVVEIKGRQNVYDFSVKYNQAFENVQYYKNNPSEAPQGVIDSVVALNKIYELVGVEGFGRILNMLNTTMNEKADAISKYFKVKNTSKNVLVDELEKTYPNNSAIVVEKTSPEYRQYAKNIEQHTGKKVVFVDFVNKHGAKEIRGVVTTDNYIYIDPLAIGKYGKDAIVSQLVFQEQVRLTRTSIGVESLNKLISEFEKLAPELLVDIDKIPKNLRQEELVGRFLKSKYDATLLFKYDKKSFTNIRDFIERRLKVLNDKNIKYSEYVKLSEFVNDIIINNVDGYAKAVDFMIDTNGIKLTEDEFNMLRADKDGDSFKTSFIPLDMNMNWAIVDTILSDLSSKSITSHSGEFDVRNTLNRHSYNNEFVTSIEQQYNKPFNEAMNDYLETNYGVVFNNILKMFLRPYDIFKSGLFKDGIEQAFKKPTDIKKYLTPLGEKILGRLDKIETSYTTKTQGRFARTRAGNQRIEVSLHSTDIISTLAHEITHYIIYNNVSQILNVATFADIEKAFNDFLIKNNLLDKYTAEKQLEILDKSLYFFNLHEIFAGHEKISANKKERSETGITYTYDNSHVTVYGTGEFYGFEYFFNKKVSPDYVWRDVFYQTYTVENGNVVETTENQGYRLIDSKNTVNVPNSELDTTIKDMLNKQQEYKNITTTDKGDGTVDVSYSETILNKKQAFEKAFLENQSTVTNLETNTEESVAEYFSKSKQDVGLKIEDSSADLLARIKDINNTYGYDNNNLTQVFFKDGYQVTIGNPIKVDASNLTARLKALAKNLKEGQYLTVKNINGEIEIHTTMHFDKNQDVSFISSTNNIEYWQPFIQKTANITNQDAVDVLERAEAIRNTLETRKSEVQNIKEGEEIIYYTTSLRALTENAPDILAKMSEQHTAIAILDALYGENVKLTDYQRRIRDALTVSAKYHAMNNLYTDSGIIQKIDTYFKELAHFAGKNLSLVSEIYARVDPFTTTITDFGTKYGVDVSKNTDVVDLKNKMNTARKNKNYSDILKINQAMVELMVDLGKKYNPKLKDLFSGDDASKKRAWKMLFNNIISFRYLAMLSNPATHVRNVASNSLQKTLVNKTDGVFQLMFQKMFNKKIQKDINIYEIQLNTLNEQLNNFADKTSTQYKDVELKRNRTQDFLEILKNTTDFKAGKISEEVKTFVTNQYVNNSYLDYILYNMSSKYDSTGEKSVNLKIKQKTQYSSDVLQKFSDIIMSSLEGLDVKFVRAETITNLENLIQANHGTDLKNITQDQLETYMKIAIDQSLELYFRNDNAFNSWWYQTSQKHWALNVLMGSILPFPRVASNMLSQIYKHSPMYFAQTLAQQLKGNVTGSNTFYTQLAKQYGQAVTGTTFMILGVLLKMLGVLDLDKDEYNGMVFTLGDVRFNIADLAPSVTPLLLGAHIVSDNPVESILSGLYDQTLLGNINSMFSYNYSLEQAFLLRPIETYMLQYVPAILKSMARSTDPHLKDLSGDYRFLKRIASSIPVVSNFLVPNKKDPYSGEDYVKSGWTVGPIDFVSAFNMFSPIRIMKDNPSYLKSRVEDIDAQANFATGRLTINGVGIKLSNKELARYGAIRGRIIGSMLTNMFHNQKLTAEQQTAQAKSIYSKASQLAKIDYWINEGNMFVFSDYKEAAEARKYLGNTSKIIVVKNYKKSRFIEKK